MGVERLQSETDIPSSPKNYKAWNFTYCTCLLGVAFTFLLNFNCFCPNSSVFFGLDLGKFNFYLESSGMTPVLYEVET